MTSFYTPDQRAVQDQFETTRLADLMTQVIVHHELEDAERAFIESREMFFLASVDAAGTPTVSYKGGAPGFIRALDARTLAFPLYDGNGMYLSAGNMRATGKVGLLFIDFETPHRLRVQGTATLHTDRATLDGFVGADLVAKVAIDVIFVNCSRYIPKHQRLSASPYVPTAACTPPFAQWKRIDVVQESLPPRDHGRADEAGGTITVEEYQAKLLAGEA
jgi:predicted pyridoxine 5'-phosphate oxidase superfamily flavin-nucleotide-binding protein